MASMSIRAATAAAAACAATNRSSNPDFSPSSNSVARLPPPDSLPIRAAKPKSRSGLKMTTAAAATELSRSQQARTVTKKREKRNGAPTIDHERIDQWMPEAVVEIVKNLKQAPLLMQVYGNSSDGRIEKMKTERAVEEEWRTVKESWSGKEEAPEGVILVEEVDAEEEEGVELATTKAWGVVIQGRGCEYGPACYLLKTSRVRSGVGSACTHFCLTKVTSFRESAFSQLTNCMLVQS